MTQKADKFGGGYVRSSDAYLLTPRGIESKATITVHFLKRKMAEYETLKAEIEQLQHEVRELGARRPE